MVGKTLPTGDAGVLLPHHDHLDDDIGGDHSVRPALLKKKTAAMEAPISALVIGDIAAALGSSALVAPFVAVIDKAIIQNQAGAARLEVSLLEGFKGFFQKPMTFLRRPEVLMVMGVYGITYTTANVISTTSKVYSYSPDMPKLVGTTVANMGAAIAKDRAYARMFGVVAPRSLPTLSYIFFLSRDVTTMGASFNIPEPMSNELVTNYGFSKYTADVTAQLFCPVFMQFFTTPMHLMGLDYYNRPQQTLGQRYALIASNYSKTVIARMARILPAFGFGGLGNKILRENCHDFANRMAISLKKGASRSDSREGIGISSLPAAGRLDGVIKAATIASSLAKAYSSRP